MTAALPFGKWMIQLEVASKYRCSILLELLASSFGNTSCKEAQVPKSLQPISAGMV